MKSADATKFLFPDLRRRQRGTIVPNLILSEQKILDWADAHLARHYRWPGVESGRIDDAAVDPRLSWRIIDDALRHGRYGLPGGSTLAHLLAKRRHRLLRSTMRRLSADEIVALARDHHRRTGRWPNKQSGKVLGVPPGMPAKTWSAIHQMLVERGDAALQRTTLCDLLTQRVGRWTWKNQPRLTVEQVLKWADAHRRRTGRFPITKPSAGPVLDAPQENWWAIHNALYKGLRGLPRIGGLAKLLDRYRNVRNKADQPPLTERQILEWADAHFARTGAWPQSTSEPVHGVPNERWSNISSALYFKRRGLRFGNHLAVFLVKHRGKRHLHRPPRLRYGQILKWIDEYFARTGRAPNFEGGLIPGVPGETWSTVAHAMSQGRRGMRRGYHLSSLLRDKRPRMIQPRHRQLNLKEILQWVDAHYARTGELPARHSGPIPEAGGLKWSSVAHAMKDGMRGLRRGYTLERLLRAKRLALYRRRGLPLNRSDILEWAAAHHELTGSLPTNTSGPVIAAKGEDWAAIDASLRAGARTLRRAGSLAQFLREHYRPASPGIGRPLSEDLIIQWAEAFRQRVGSWPTRRSVYTDPLRQEKWSMIDQALRKGHRGLPGGSSLAKLLREHRAAVRIGPPPRPRRHPSSGSVTPAPHPRDVMQQLIREFPHLRLPR